MLNLNYFEQILIKFYLTRQKLPDDTYLTQIHQHVKVLWSYAVGIFGKTRQITPIFLLFRQN